jgi:hypothetical protein
MTGDIPKNKRPEWVWAFSIFFFLSASWTILSFYLINAGAVHLSLAELAYLSTLTDVDYGLTTLIVLANLFGAIALFRLRKAAFYLFLTAFGVNLLYVAWHKITKGWVAAYGGADLSGFVIGWTLLIAVCIYSRKLMQRGVLT